MKRVMKILDEISKSKIKMATEILRANKDNEKLSKVLELVKFLK